MVFAAGAGVSEDEFRQTIRVLMNRSEQTPSGSEERATSLIHLFNFIAEIGINHLNTQKYSRFRSVTIEKAKGLKTEAGCTNELRAALNRFLRILGEPTGETPVRLPRDRSRHMS